MSSKSGTGANAVPLGPLHPILAAKMSQKQEMGSSDGSDTLSKLEMAKRVASSLFPSEYIRFSIYFVNTLELIFIVQPLQYLYPFIFDIFPRIC